MNYAVIDDLGNVVDAIIAPTLEVAQSVTPLKCVLITDDAVGVGWTWDGNSFIAPESTVPLLPDPDA